MENTLIVCAGGHTKTGRNTRDTSHFTHKRYIYYQSENATGSMHGLRMKIESPGFDFFGSMTLELSEDGRQENPDL